MSYREAGANCDTFSMSLQHVVTVCLFSIGAHTDRFGAGRENPPPEPGSFPAIARADTYSTSGSTGNPIDASNGYDAL